MIDLLSLKEANRPHEVAIEQAILRVARSGRYILGPELEKFEAEFAAYCGVKHCIGTGNALEAMQLILLALGIGPTDRVIVASNTYIATWLAVTHAGARVQPVEPDPRTFNLDPARVEDAIQYNTRAILVTHLYGRCADMDELQSICDRRGLVLIADAAQAAGARYKGRRAGSLCRAEAFSFYPSKNLGGMGDGGCITTNDDMIAEKARRMRNYGGVGRIDHTVIGINSRLDEMQAAILSAKLPYLDRENAKRAQRANRYSMLHHEESIITPIFDTQTNWHQYVIRAQERDEMIAILAANGVDSHIHYPEPPHLEGAYSGYGFKRGDFPIAEQLAGEVMSLPIGYEIPTREIVQKVFDAARAVKQGKKYA